MKSITKLLDDECSKIVHENARKIGFQKAVKEMKCCIMSRVPKYATRSNKASSLSSEQTRIQLLSNICEEAMSKSRSDNKSTERKKHQPIKCISAAAIECKKNKKPIAVNCSAGILRRSERLASKTSAFV